MKVENLVYGVHAVAALFANPHRKIRQLWVNIARSDEKVKNILSSAQAQNIPVALLNLEKMQKMFSDMNHQGVVAEASSLPEFTEKDCEYLLSQCTKNPYILVLDGVTDPHNLGACLRSADAAAIDFIIIPKDKSASVTSIVSKVACGAAESVPIVRVTNLVRTLKLLKDTGIWVFGASDDASQTLYECDLTIPCAFVLGAEGHGMRRLTRENCDIIFSIPMYGSVSSLNVSVAAGICLFEGARQRNLG